MARNLMNKHGVFASRDSIGAFFIEPDNPLMFVGGVGFRGDVVVGGRPALLPELLFRNFDGVFLRKHVLTFEFVVAPRSRETTGNRQHDGT